MSGVRLIATFGQWWFPLPRPGFGDADGSAALSADDPGVGAQDPIAQGLAFGAGQEPVRQSRRSQASRLQAIAAAAIQVWLIRALREGKRPSPVFPGPDLVLDPCVSTMTGLQNGDLPELPPRRGWGVHRWIVRGWPFSPR